ncbi:MAG: V-type ATP synthase subunit D [Spirochaetaceae bacterium]|nr:MAG: V-type ATP synthase subunit D [Spirochaetaceae bacterium]
MAKIKLSKNELKREKDSLKRYLRYLPTLILKKQQLQAEIRRIETKLEETRAESVSGKQALELWIGLFGTSVDIGSYVQVAEVVSGTSNIAGIDIPVFERVRFQDLPWDLFLTPLWVDRAVEVLQRLVALEMEMRVLQEQCDIIAAELRVTSQRINLFEKVKIPEARENIRRIRIFMGDQEVAAVVRGKISKNKIVKGGVA